MNRSLILLLAASASACAHHQRSAHHAAADHPSRAAAHASHDASATEDSDAERQTIDEAPRRATNAHNASAEGYVSPTANGQARERDLEASGSAREQKKADSADPVFGPTTDPGEAVAADNTAQNKADREGDSLTPLDQGSSEADRKTTQQIRKAVMAHDDLSFNAKNVKIITRDGHVTLRGPVNHQKERLAIGEIASRVAGPSHVENQLEIKSK